MSDEGFLRFCKKSSSNLLRNYCSVIGLKIAIPVGIFIMTPFLFHVIFHEYGSGNDTLYHLLLNPSLWGVFLLAFLLLMFVLSKIVILPLKRFENHISDLEHGKKTGPFLLDRKDEIGFLAERFNSLQKSVTTEIESRDVQLSVLYNFTNATSGIFDMPTLMENFFTILRTAVEFDIGAYALSSRKHTEGGIYSTFGALDDKDACKITASLLSRVRNYCPGFPKIDLLDVTAIKVRSAGKRPGKGTPTHIIDLPINYRGEPVGIISLISYSSTGTDPIMGLKVFNAMAVHTNTVIERLLAHIVAEESRLSHILSSMSEGVYLIDKNGHATSVNKKGMELVGAFCNYSLECAKKGFEQGLGSCPQNQCGACEFSEVFHKVRSFGPEFDKVHTEEIKSKDGIVLQLSISSLKTDIEDNQGYVITAKDVTEDRLIQKRLLLSSKLAALGEMAAGIAHEVNNPLQVMMANLELLEVNVSERGIKRVEHLKDGVLRIKNIVRDLLIFAREQTTEVEDVDINRVIEKVVDLLRNQLKLANVNIELDLDRRALAVRCNKNLFQQVIINLLQNAKDAIEESKKGTRAYIRTVLLPGGIVVVEVSDDGPGIPDTVVDRIFDPFFTTKDVGKGTGLGLSVSRRIIEGMGGNIAVASSPSTGTTFTINLLHNRNTRRKEDRYKSGEYDHSRLAGKSLIIIDDEEGVLRAVKEGIGQKVSDIEIANDGKAALDMMMDNDYDMVLLDIKMPGMNGIELYRHLNESKPYLAERIIFLTGDIENESTDSFIKLTGCRYLPKPFTMKELLNVMCESEMEMR
ncbi:MAG: response regulator [Deltaproteobacteria bacterium]|nr:response regulator [Deltaproteobacteria bacterium]